MRILLLKGDVLALSGRREETVDVYMELIRMAEEAGDEEFVRLFRKKLGNISKER